MGGRRGKKRYTVGSRKGNEEMGTAARSKCVRTLKGPYENK